MKTTLTRDFYIPKIYTDHITSELYDVYINKDTITAHFFKGKRKAKPLWQFRFRSLESMQTKIDQTIESLKDNEDRKARRKLESKNVSLIELGTIFVSSWGYEQTNVDYYQVIAVSGRKVTLKPICSKSVFGSAQASGMACDVLPVKDAFKKDEPELVKIASNMGNGKTYININQVQTAFLWDGTANYCSWYY